MLNAHHPVIDLSRAALDRPRLAELLPVDDDQETRVLDRVEVQCLECGAALPNVLADFVSRDGVKALLITFPACGCGAANYRISAETMEVR